MKNEKSKTTMEKVNRAELMALLKEGGATLNKDGEKVKYKKGYQVSRRDCFKIAAGDVDKIHKAINKLFNEIKSGDFVGLWVDSDGLCYVDISEHISGLSKALAVGRSRHQISIFDWSAMDCIYCNK